MRDRANLQYEAFYPSHHRWYKVVLSPMDDGLSIFHTDITDGKVTEDKLNLEQLLREKRIEALSYMAGGLAHEISNPLAIIHGWARDLENMASGTGLLPSQEVAALSEKIRKTTDRASGILRGLRAFGRDASQDPMEPASIYIILDNALELQESRFAREKIEIRTDLQPDVPLFCCREVQIGQILANLLSNAFDAIVHSDADERWVSLNARFSADELSVEVSDSGPGIPEQQKEHLMQPFFTTKELGLGMGIGLSLSRAIAQSHGGTLTLIRESAPTSFRLSLPAVTAPGVQDSAPHCSEAPDEPARR